MASPEDANGVEELPVPFGPQHGEVSYLIATLTDVPRLGDQLHARDDGVLMDEVEERAQAVDLVEPSGQRRGEVEAEPVDVHLRHPIAEAVHDEAQHLWMPRVQRVACARVVDVPAPVALVEAVVRGVVDAAQAQG